MKEQVLMLKEFVDIFNALRSYGVGRRAVMRNVHCDKDGSYKVTILFPDMDYLFAFCLALKAWPYLTMRIDGLFLLLTIR